MAKGIVEESHLISNWPTIWWDQQTTIFISDKITKGNDNFLAGKGA